MFENFQLSASIWIERHYFRLAIFNIILLLLVLLRSAGYFEPFFLLTINVIVFLSMTLSVVLLHTNSKSMFLIALLFWVVTAFFRVTNLGVWAERSSLYSFQAVFIGMALMVIESAGISFQIKLPKNKTNAL